MRGVTLIELMVALSVLAILATIGFPSFQDMLARNRLTSAANDVLAAMHLAKSEAIRRNAAIRWCMDSASGGWVVEDMGGADLRVGQLHPSVGVAAANVDTITVPGQNCVRFRADGLSYGAGSALITNGSVTLSIGARSTVINVRTGAINVG